MEIDHVFIRADVGAPQAEVLVEFGLIEGSRNVHPGQGTANRRFFFENAYLELLWLSNEREAQSPITQPTKLYERLTSTAANVSPFGVCFRPSGGDVSSVPFPSWSYRPKYVPDGFRIEIVEPVLLTEPLWFFLPNGNRPDGVSDECPEPLSHVHGIHEITGLRLGLASDRPLSQAARKAVESGCVEIFDSPAPVMEVCFDRGPNSRTHAFLPELPLRFRW